MKFKVGDKVRVVRKSSTWNSIGEMDKWLGKVMTIKETRLLDCQMEEDSLENEGCGWYWDETCLELENTQTLTITTSDSVTTLTDGTNTVSVSRYYLDKDNRKIAIKEVVNKYFNELDRIEEEKNVPKVGDMVKVIDSGRNFSFYSEWLIKNNVSISSAIKWTDGRAPVNGEMFKVTNIGVHPNQKNCTLCLIEDEKNAFVINIEGLALVKER